MCFSKSFKTVWSQFFVYQNHLKNHLIHLNEKNINLNHGLFINLTTRDNC